MTLSSPTSNPSTISFNLHSQARPENKNPTISIDKNNSIYKQKIIPIAEATEGTRGSICGVIVKISAVNRKNEDELYQVYVIDESSLQPLRVSVYLPSEDKQPYFKVSFKNCFKNSTLEPA